MDTLIIIKEEGFSIIETLVGITILGILIVISLKLFGDIYKMPELLLQREALHLATQELNKSISDYQIKDTSYTNQQGNLTLVKTIKETEQENLLFISVSVHFKSNKKTLITLSTYLKK